MYRNCVTIGEWMKVSFGGSLLKIILLILHILHLQIMPIGFVLLWWLLRSNTGWNTWAIYHAWL